MHLPPLAFTLLTFGMTNLAGLAVAIYLGRLEMVLERY